MADHFLSKIRVAPEDFVEAGGEPALQRHRDLRRLLAERAGPEVAALFAEPLVSRGNDAAAPTVSWYGDAGGEARPLSALPGPERDRAARYLAEHLRPLRALAEDPAQAGLIQAALSVYGAEDILVCGDRPVIVNWGLLPGGRGASAMARPSHYAATLGRYLPLEAEPAARAEPVTSGEAVPLTEGPVTTPEPKTGGGRVRSGLSPIAWVPLLALLILAAAILAWLLTPGVRLFPQGERPPAITNRDMLAATEAQNEALRARQAQLEAALDGAVCRADGELILPDGLTPRGLTPPAPGVAPDPVTGAAADGLLPTAPGQVLVPDPAAEEGTEAAPITLLELIAARTVLVLASGGDAAATGSGLVIGPGLIVTNQHVIAAAQAPDGQVVVAGGALEAPQLARIVKAEGPLMRTGSDLALLEIDETNLPAFTVALPETPQTLTNVVAAGYPGDALEMDAEFARLMSGEAGAVPALTVTDGVINGVQRIGAGTEVLMHSAPLSRGNSGGPLVDMCGRLAGVNAFVRQGRMQNRGFALSGADLMAFLAGTAAAPEVDQAACAPVVQRPQLATEAAPAPEQE